MKNKKCFKVLIAIMLIFCLGLGTAQPCFAARAKQYVKEVKLSYGDTDDQAKKWLTDNGYKVVNQNLNKDANDAFSKKKSVYMGYKTTTNADEAVTDIALMDMKGGYSFSDYQEKLKEEYKKYEVTAQEQMVIIKEFRKNYAAKNPNAVYAHQALNNYKEDDSGKLFGDFLLDESLTMEALVKIITQMTGQTIEQINLILSCGIAENGNDNFLQRFAGMTPAQIEAAKKSTDPAIYDNAYKLLYGARNLRLLLTALDEELEGNKGKDDLEKETEYTAAVMDMMLLAAQLNGYKYGEGTLTDFFKNDSITVKDLYPLASVMNQAQINSVGFAGFEMLVKTTNLGNAEDWKQSSTSSEGTNVEAEKVSIYVGVDRSMFSNSVAMTSDAQREMAQTGDTSPLYGNIAPAAEIAMLTTIGVAGLTSIAMGVGLAVQRAQFTAMAAAKNITVSAKWMTSPAKAIQACKASRLNLLSTQGGKVNWLKYAKVDPQGASAYFKVVRIAAMNITMYVAMGIMLIVSAVFMILEVVNYYNPDYLDIPEIMLDYGSNKDGDQFVRYDGVKDMDGKMGDTNGYVGKQWNALYVTKDKNAGAPLLASAMTFVDKTIVDKEQKPIHYFGQTAPVSTNLHTFGNSPSIYMYWLQDLSYSSSMFPGSIFANKTANISVLTGIGGIGIGFILAAIIFRRRKKEEVIAITTSE